MALSIQTATIAQPHPITPNTNTNNSSRPSSADSSIKSPVSATGSNTPQEKRKTSRRANTAERRATHNAVERQRRETLNGRFLDLASILPNLSSVRRPSKSAIVNSSIASLHQSRRQKSLAALELRALYTQFVALKAEADEWRARAGVAPVEEGERSREFWEMVREGEEILLGSGSGGVEGAMRRVREIGEEEGRARVLAEAASSTSHGGGARRDEDDEDFVGDEEVLPAPLPTPPVPSAPVLPATTAAQVHQQQQQHQALVAHQQHLAQVHAAAQAQLQQQQQQAQAMMMRARAASMNVAPPQQFAYQQPLQQQQQHIVHHHHQQQQHQVPLLHQHQHQQHQIQVPFDSGADLFPNTNATFVDPSTAAFAPFDKDWTTTFNVNAINSPPMYDDSASSSGGSSPSPISVGRSRSGSLNAAMGVPVAAGFF